MTQLFGGIEAGGTKFICGIGTSAGEILVETRIDTTSPEETLSACVDFFEEQSLIFGKISAIGIASFGPLDPRLASAKYGHILQTPKADWSNASAKPVRKAAGYV